MRAINLHGDERTIYGDRAYWSEAQRWISEDCGVRYRINRQAHPSAPLSESWRAINRARSRIRSRACRAVPLMSAPRPPPIPAAFDFSGDTAAGRLQLTEPMVAAVRLEDLPRGGWRAWTRAGHLIRRV